MIRGSPDSPLIDLQAEDTMLMLRRIAWRMQEAPGGLRANAIADDVIVVGRRDPVK